MMKKQNKIYLVIGIVVVVLIAAIVIFSNQQSEEEVIKIGAILPLSGSNAVYGQEIQNAIELAREEINSEGGINGKVLKIIYEDDQADPKMGTNSMQKLVNVEKVFVVLGSWASGSVVASAPIAEENQVIVLASAISPLITDAGDYIFRMQPSAIFYTSKSTELLRKEGFSTAAIIYINNEFGVGLKNAFISDFESRGGDIISVEAYEQGASDFRTQLTKIKDKNPEIVFIPGYQDTVDVIKQMKELGIECKILAGPPFESQSSIEKLGNMADGVLYAYHFVAGKNDTKSQQYEQAYLEKYGVPTGGFAPLMYDGTYIIANALKKCGEETSCIKKELYSTEYNGVTGKVTFDENGDPLIPIVIKTVKNGKFVPYNK